MLNDRLRRVTDLFVEGAELYLGLDDSNEPIVMWVNKLNSFEVEEARRDGAVQRGIRVAALTADDNPERIAMEASVRVWDNERLAQNRLDQMSDEIYLRVLDDIDTDPEMREAVDMVRRGTVLLATAPEDDPRREALLEAQNKYLEAIRVNQERVRNETLADLLEMSRRDLENDFTEAWRNRASLEVFMEERRVSELYVALRDCQASVERSTDDPATFRYDHSACDHSRRLLLGRDEVRHLPERVIELAIETLEKITVPAREAGNSDAPESSSDSPERPSAEEESAPSIPTETPSAAPLT